MGMDGKSDSIVTRQPVLGVIGGIGSGKSEAAKALASRGGKVVSGDLAGHLALLVPGIRQQIAGRWPNAIDSAGEVDRKRLGHIVFADPKDLRHLESLVFPWIKSRLHQEISAARSDAGVAFVVLDAAIMLEAGWDGHCDRIVFVDAPRALRVARVASRGWTATELDRREATQMPLEDKRRHAHATVTNDGDRANLQSQCDTLLRQWGLLK